MHPKLSAIGTPMQIAYVPHDFDAALRHWTETMGVGPFYLLEKIALENLRFRGEPSDAVFTIALAYWGDMQIELIRPDNDAAGIYRGEFVPPEGCMHHVCLITDDIAKTREICVESGMELLIEAKVGEDGGVIYVDTGGGAGTLVEILQPATGSGGLFDMIKAASVGWDGSDPVRRLG